MALSAGMPGAATVTSKPRSESAVTEPDVARDIDGGHAVLLVGGQQAISSIAVGGAIIEVADLCLLTGGIVTVAYNNIIDVAAVGRSDDDVGVVGHVRSIVWNREDGFIKGYRCSSTFGRFYGGAVGAYCDATGFAVLVRLNTDTHVLSFFGFEGESLLLSIEPDIAFAVRPQAIRTVGKLFLSGVVGDDEVTVAHAAWGKALEFLNDLGLSVDIIHDVAIGIGGNWLAGVPVALGAGFATSLLITAPVGSAALGSVLFHVGGQTIDGCRTEPIAEVPCLSHFLRIACAY